MTWNLYAAHRPYSQIKVYKTHHVSTITSETDASIGCLVILSLGLPTASRNDKEIVFYEDLRSSMDRLSSAYLMLAIAYKGA